MENLNQKLTVFCWGSRGDDALGEEIYQALQKHPRLRCQQWPIRLVYDQQLNYEHALDLLDATLCLFVDASRTCAAPYEFLPIEANECISFTTHQLSPEQLIYITKSSFDKFVPAFFLQIRGYEYSLGAAMSAESKQNMQQALEFLDLLFTDCSFSHWHQRETLLHA